MNEVTESSVEPVKIPKGVLKTADKYQRRLAAGDKIMRDANGCLQWSSGKPVGAKTVAFMIDTGIIKNLDTDIFGDFDRGQTIGLPE